MQFNISVGELSFAKIAMRSSAGRWLMGGWKESSEDSTCNSLKLPTPTEDWESLACMKKSVSSSFIARSGEVEVDDWDASPLDSLRADRDRAMAAEVAVHCRYLDISSIH
jgi:hypothetical protein